MLCTAKWAEDCCCHKADDMMLDANACCSLSDCTIGFSNPAAVTNGMYCGIVAAVEASDHCGIKTALAALTERARTAKRASILVAIATMMLLVCFTLYVAMLSLRCR